MYDLFVVTYRHGQYNLWYTDTSDEIIRPKHPTLVDTPDTVGVVVLDGASGQYLDGEWTTDDHRRNFLRGKRSR